MNVLVFTKHPDWPSLLRYGINFGLIPGRQAIDSNLVFCNRTAFQNLYEFLAFFWSTREIRDVVMRNQNRDVLEICEHSFQRIRGFFTYQILVLDIYEVPRFLDGS